MNPNPIKAKSNASKKEVDIRNELLMYFKNCPIPDSELLQNLPLFISRQNFSTMLFIQEIYLKAMETHGVVMEFGVRWGRNLAFYETLRGIYEPFNHNRKIVGFDTFKGFPSVTQKDGNDEIIQAGGFNVTEGYEDFLSKILDYHEQESPISNIKKYELIKGDASKSIVKYLQDYPETIISLAYFDFDIYQPTLDCLTAIIPHLTRGSVVAFDELNNRTYPGETIALKEVMGLNKYKIRHSQFSPTQSYFILD